LLPLEDHRRHPTSILKGRQFLGIWANKTQNLNGKWHYVVSHGQANALSSCNVVLSSAIIHCDKNQEQGKALPLPKGKGIGLFKKNKKI
jgi:hypothetical protein